MSKSGIYPGAIARLANAPATTRAVHALAEKLAQNVRDQHRIVGAFKGGSGDIELPVLVFDSKTDRAVSRVVLAHPAGQAEQAKNGVLTKAAAAAGLEVHR